MRLVSAVLVVWSLAASAPGQDEPALGGLDPVALCGGEETAGRADLVDEFGHYRYRFASEANRDRFRAEPERWSIQWDGGCARMGPLSGRGDPQRWTVFDERIYIFASDSCRTGFMKAPERFVVTEAVAAEVDSVEPGTAALEGGRRWIDRAVQAHGGADVIDELRTLRLRTESEQSGWKRRYALDITADGHLLRRDVWLPPEEARSTSDTTWVVADAVFTLEEGREDPVTSAAARTDLRRFAYREPLTILWSRSRDGFVAEHLGAGRLGETDVVDVRVTADAVATTLHLDPDTGSILGLSWRGRPNDGITRDVTETFTTWRTVAGVRVPSARTVVVDGKAAPTMADHWTSIELAAAAEAVRRLADRTAVERAVLDYVEGLYRAKPELIERSVHPELAKYGMWRPDQAREFQAPSKMPFQQLVDLAARWNAHGEQGKDLAYKVEILDVSDVTAAAKLTAKWGIDYMQLMRRDGKWKIIHVLRQSHPPVR